MRTLTRIILSMAMSIGLADCIPRGATYNGTNIEIPTMGGTGSVQAMDNALGVSETNVRMPDTATVVTACTRLYLNGVREVALLVREFPELSHLLARVVIPRDITTVCGNNHQDGTPLGDNFSGGNNWWGFGTNWNMGNGYNVGNGVGVGPLSGGRFNK